MRALAAELCERGTSVTHDTVWRFVRRQELTFKKTLVASEQTVMSLIVDAVGTSRPDAR